MTVEKQAARVFRIGDVSPSFNVRGASTHELMNHATPASMAAGVVYFRDSEIPFTQWYDEVMICFAVEEAFAIVIDGVENRLNPGDMMWLPAGTSLIYRSRGTSTAYFVVTPADWSERRPAA
jgi:ethanolamine utilization protein EutQ (cupin superfamily)